MHWFLWVFAFFFEGICLYSTAGFCTLKKIESKQITCVIHPWKTLSKEMEHVGGLWPAAVMYKHTLGFWNLYALEWSVFAGLELHSWKMHGAHAWIEHAKVSTGFFIAIHLEWQSQIPHKLSHDSHVRGSQASCFVSCDTFPVLIFLFLLCPKAAHSIPLC